MLSDPLLLNLVILDSFILKKSMRSPATGIGSCKTEFHLPRDKTMGGSYPQIYLTGLSTVN